MRIRKANPAWVPDAEARLSALLGVSLACQSALAAKKVNPDLSPDGRRKAAEAIARPALQKIADWEEAGPDKIEGRIRSTWERVLGVSLPKPPADAAERFAFELRQREIRDELRKLDPTQRLVIYLASTDPEVIAAVETAPLTLTRDDPNDAPKLAPFPEQVRAAMIHRAQASDPDAATEMHALAVLRDIYQSACDTARGEILREFPALRRTRSWLPPPGAHAREVDVEPETGKAGAPGDYFWRSCVGCRRRFVISDLEAAWYRIRKRADGAPWGPPARSLACRRLARAGLGPSSGNSRVRPAGE